MPSKPAQPHAQICKRPFKREHGHRLFGWCPALVSRKTYASQLRAQALIANTGGKHWQTLQAKIRAQPLGDGLFLATHATKTFSKLYLRPALPA
tara:strand:- start:321 stop:602 length:282 start_codon:yes stop_codon:yes gene_type:complete